MALRLGHGFLVLCLLLFKGSHGSEMEHNFEAHNVGWLTMDDVYVGNIMTINIPFYDPSTFPPFLPKQVADSIPFSRSELPNILQLFSIPQGSLKSEAIEQTLALCESRQIEGEVQTCATSLESLLDFVQNSFGAKADVKALTATHENSILTRPATLEKYTIVEAEEIPMHMMMGCHVQRYPYAIYYCHYQLKRGETDIYRISLRGHENGIKVNTYVACHKDTTYWDPNHISFRVLHTKPGSTSHCHIFTIGDILWVQYKKISDVDAVKKESFPYHPYQSTNEKADKSNVEKTSMDFSSKVFDFDPIKKDSVPLYFRYQSTNEGDGKLAI